MFIFSFWFLKKLKHFHGLLKSSWPVDTVPTVLANMLVPALGSLTPAPQSSNTLNSDALAPGSSLLCAPVSPAKTGHGNETMWLTVWDTARTLCLLLLLLPITTIITTPPGSHWMLREAGITDVFPLGLGKHKSIQTKQAPLEWDLFLISYLLLSALNHTGPTSRNRDVGSLFHPLKEFSLDTKLCTPPPSFYLLSLFL